MEAALVNPDITGTDTKSIKKPREIWNMIWYSQYDKMNGEKSMRGEQNHSPF